MIEYFTSFLSENKLLMECQLVWAEENNLILLFLSLFYLCISLVVDEYSFNYFQKYNPTYQSFTSCQKFTAYLRHLFNYQLSSLFTIHIHLLTQIANIFLIITFYKSAKQSQGQCQSIQHSLFITSLVVVIFHKFASFLILWLQGFSSIGKIIKLFLMQLFSFQIVRTIYLRYLFNKKKDLYHTTKLLIIIHTFLVSIPLCYIQLIYKWQFGGHPFINFSLSLTIINIIHSHFIYDYNSLGFDQVDGFHISFYQRKYKMDQCNGWTLGIKYDATWIASVIYRIIDITSTIFIYSLAWISLGWVSFVVVMSVLFVAIPIMFYFEIAEQVIFIHAGSITVEPATVCIQAALQIIYLILITIWICVPFNCPTCPTYNDRELILTDKSLFAVFIYCWIGRTLSLCAYLAAEGYDEYNTIWGVMTGTIRHKWNANAYSTGDELDLFILQQKLFCATYDYFDKEKKITMLMKAIQHRKIILCHYLMDTQQVALNDCDTKENNILDYVYIVNEQIKGWHDSLYSDRHRNDKKTKKQNLGEYQSILSKIHSKSPELKSHKGKRNIFLCACYMGDMYCVDELIQLDANIITSVDTDGVNGWSIASLQDQHQIMKYLSDNYGISGKKRIKPLDGDVYKVVMMGPGSCGKSTLFGQMRDLYSDYYSGDNIWEITNGKPYMYQNVVQGMLRILRKIQKMSEQNEEYKIDFQDNQEIYTAIQHIVSNENQWFELEQINWATMKRLANDIAVIWDMNIVQNTFYDRGCLEGENFFVDSNLDYFLDRVKEIFTKEYVISKQDIFRMRVRTHGIIEQKIVDKGLTFNSFDVGGTRHERRKWIHLFDSVDKILFVVSLSSIYEVLNEDETVNGMTESIKLWKDIVNGKWFKFTKFYLLFTKNDVYRNWLNKKHERGERNDVCEKLKEVLECDADLEMAHVGQYFNSKDTLLSHGFIHDIEREYKYDMNGDQVKNGELKFLSNDVMQLIDLYLDVYFEGFYDETMEYIKRQFLKCDKSENKQIQSYALSTLNVADIKRVLSKVFI